MQEMLPKGGSVNKSPILLDLKTYYKTYYYRYYQRYYVNDKQCK